jgi:DNA-binding transcriptional LysR family regulator
MDLREIETFLALCEELHFGRTAQRLHLTTARVSQTIRGFEGRIGAPLFERTSRSVRMTPLGEELWSATASAYQQIDRAVAEAVTKARGIEGVLRVGFLGTGANESTSDIFGEFRTRHPACNLELVEVHCADPLTRLRSGEVDVLITRLPVTEPDLVVGPILVSEPRVLAVPVSHPFASLVSVSVEDLARDKVIDIAGPAPDYWWEAHVPQFTPAGRRVPRGAVVATFQELLTQVASGQGISPVVESVSRYFPRPDIALIPIRDMPNSEVALVWRAAGETALVRAFADISSGHVAIAKPVLATA